MSSPVDSIPHCIKIVTQNPRSYMVSGLKDGSVVMYEFDSSRGILSEKYKIITIGNTAVDLVPFYEIQEKKQCEKK